jgi:hypothetical protein
MLRSLARTAVQTSLLVSLAAALSACAPGQPDDVVIGGMHDIRRAASGVRWETDETIRLETTGVVSIDLDSFAGSVLVKANKNLSETLVTVERATRHGFPRYGEAGRSLDLIDYTVSLDRGTSGEEIVVVRANSSGTETVLGRANVRIETPELGAVRIRTSRGDVQVLENRGSIDIVTSHGNVSVATPWSMRDSVSIMNREGDVEYRVRGESTGLFDLETVGGVVSTRCRYGRWMGADPENRADRVIAVLNGGDNPIVIRTSDGDIDVAIVSDPVGSAEFQSHNR